jgi:hypothetical protein
MQSPRLNQVELTICAEIPTSRIASMVLWFRPENSLISDRNQQTDEKQFDGDVKLQMLFEGHQRSPNKPDHWKQIQTFQRFMSIDSANDRKDKTIASSPQKPSNTDSSQAIASQIVPEKITALNDQTLSLWQSFMIWCFIPKRQIPCPEVWREALRKGGNRLRSPTIAWSGAHFTIMKEVTEQRSLHKLSPLLQLRSMWIFFQNEQNDFTQSTGYIWILWDNANWETQA